MILSHKYCGLALPVLTDGINTKQGKRSQSDCLEYSSPSLRPPGGTCKANQQRPRVLPPVAADAKAHVKYKYVVVALTNAETHARLRENAC
jgi:hypothetical protein